ncbi:MULTISPECIES: PAS domain-containing protein [unclassified Caballeronia]|uniref:hybrid sensor histidine kinase/response regulator n=1 Tax=unclassified Caballeronia TaxID=2646786 RepID=UPI0028562B9C|nr:MULTISPECIES: PAS domain-containing protein [unclassified Caballeronia]MDR5739241.1 PAS domain-containing protein [Caballeronia sp. LZ016]MDR5807730.1 PAS domain-containing protein [Caballeronia sp. LZ019]
MPTINDDSLVLALLDANPLPCAILARDLSVVSGNERFIERFGDSPHAFASEEFVARLLTSESESSRAEWGARVTAVAAQALQEARATSVVVSAPASSTAEDAIAWTLDFRPLAQGTARTQEAAMLLVVKEESTRDAAAHPALMDLETALAGYRMLSEAMPIILWTASPDGLLDHISSAVLRNTAADRPLLGRAWETLTHPNDREATLERWAASVKDGSDYVIDHRLRQPDGAYRWMRSLATPLKDREGAIVRWLGATIDVNEPKNIELERLRLESRYRALVTVASAVAYVCDDIGRFAIPQPSWESYTGQPWEKHQGHGWMEMIHEADRCLAGAALERAVKTDQPYRVDVRLWHAASSTYRRCQVRAAGTRDKNGDVYEWVGMITDVEETLRTAQSLREERERLDLSIEAAEIGTFHCPIPLDRIIWNPKCKEHFWLAPNAEVDLELFFQIVHPDDRQKTRLAIEQAVNDGIPYDMEYRTVSPAGEVRWIRAKGRTHLDDDGAPVRFDGITIDISRQKRLESERDRLLANERLLRLEAQHASSLKDTFLATVSHELRTPLNAMQSWSYVLRHESANAELHARGIDAIDRNVKLQARLVDDLLDLSRIAAGQLLIEMEKFDLVPLLVSEMEDVALDAAAKGIDVLRSLPESLEIEGDPTRLSQVFSNLLGNALKYTQPGGRIRVSARRRGELAEIEVADNGRGIPASFIERVFEPFAQASQATATTRTFGGLGIGLAIAKSIVNLHGGSITAHSGGEGQGSVFTVALPSRTGHDVPSRNAASSVRDDVLDGLDILLVEDEADARDAMTAVLNSVGAHVCGAESASAARACLATQRFDVIMSDIGMPHEDGYSLIQSLRHAGHRTPALAVTAFGSADDKARALQAGFDLHLSKPVDPARLFDAIRSVLAQSRVSVREG